jgi:hypothetical protein
MLMKKALLIGLVLGLAVGLAIPAMAVDLTAFGYFGMKGYIGRNAFAPPPFFMAKNAWVPGPPGGPPGWRNFDTQTGFLNQSGAMAFTPNNQTGSFMNGRPQDGFR